MTEAERTFLKSQIDRVVALETVQGDSFLAEILFIFDEGETPDLFCREVEPGPNGAYIQKGSNGHSILLSDIFTAKPPSTTA
jgi:hypothetical protein